MVLQILAVCSFTSKQCERNNQKSHLFLSHAYMFVLLWGIRQLSCECKNQQTQHYSTHTRKIAAYYYASSFQDKIIIILRYIT